jgi:hypothetical protein
MDSSLLIISLVLLTLFLVPFIILASRSSHKQKTRINLLNSFFEKEELKVSEHESWGNHIIGINPEAGKVVFISFDKVEIKTEIIDLHKIKKCEVHQLTSKVDSQTEVTNLAGLKFLYKEQSTPTLILEFFNGYLRGQLTNEMAVAKKWAGYINSSINKINH